MSTDIVEAPQVSGLIADQQDAFPGYIQHLRAARARQLALASDAGPLAAENALTFPGVYFRRTVILGRQRLLQRDRTHRPSPPASAPASSGTSGKSRRYGRLSLKPTSRPTR